MGTRIWIDSVMRPQSSSRVRNIRCLSYSYSNSCNDDDVMMSLMEAAAGQTQDKHRTKKMI